MPRQLNTHRCSFEIPVTSHGLLHTFRILTCRLPLLLLSCQVTKMRNSLLRSCRPDHIYPERHLMGRCSHLALLCKHFQCWATVDHCHSHPTLLMYLEQRLMGKCTRPAVLCNASAVDAWQLLSIAGVADSHSQTLPGPVDGPMCHHRQHLVDSQVSHLKAV